MRIKMTLLFYSMSCIFIWLVLRSFFRNQPEYSNGYVFKKINTHSYPNPYTQTNNNPQTKESDIPFGNFGSEEIHKRLQACPKDIHTVPNIVHFVWFGEAQLRFHQMLSILSAYQKLTPCVILIHGDVLPHGDWWAYLKSKVPNMVHVKRTQPELIFNVKLDRIEHKSDVARIEAILEYGGIYLDTDVIVVKTFDPLRKYNTSMSKENDKQLGSGVIVSTPNSEFIKQWYESYQSFDNTNWAYHSTMVPMRLSKLHPELIHVVGYLMHWPSISQLYLIYRADITGWKRNYCVHLWYREYDIEHDPLTIRNLKTTFGQLARNVYYGSPDIK
ncbi:unnamed protein product [Owenia fusiformis]|uniref:Uncharacterized protein n=1 Tax=Owenia fusiformis TaxID=6347 RepID=A0A8J1TUP1_OWEFU|nr:unnamed protein product [Owenia fusiformis]